MTNKLQNMNLFWFSPLDIQYKMMRCTIGLSCKVYEKIKKKIFNLMVFEENLNETHEIKI